MIVVVDDEPAQHEAAVAVVATDENGFEIVTSKRHKRLSARLSECESDLHVHVPEEQVAKGGESKAEVDVEEPVAVEQAVTEPASTQKSAANAEGKQTAVVVDKEAARPITKAVEQAREEPVVQATVASVLNAAVDSHVVPAAAGEPVQQVIIDAVEDEDTEDDSCPIEPFLEDSDVEIEPIKEDQPKSAHVDGVNQVEVAHIPLKDQIETAVKELAQEKVKVEAIDKVDSKPAELESKERGGNDSEGEDSCPMEPLLEDSDKEEDGTLAPVKLASVEAIDKRAEKEKPEPVVDAAVKNDVDLNFAEACKCCCHKKVWT